MKAKRVLLVVLLTLLIWVWADISNDTNLDNQSATISVSPNVSRDMWVSLGIRENITPVSQSAPITISLKGPNARIDQFKREALPLDVYYYPEVVAGEEISEGLFNVPIIKFVQDDPKIKELGLTVESCKPETMKVKIEKLIPKQLKVVCIDVNNNTIEGARVQPAIIEMLVKEYSAADLKAYIKLTDSQIEEARLSAIEVQPYVELDPQRLRKAVEAVKVSIPTYTEKKQTFVIPGPRVGYVVNLDMVDKYRVEMIANLTNLPYRATEEASTLYEAQQYHVLLDILPGDIPAEGEANTITRKVRYNFPAELFKAGQIVATDEQDALEVSFKLVPIVK